jgi:23S rRNA (uracil1939-C5)-methyltransferase
VEVLDDAGRGVVRIDGRPVPVEGALTGERVVCRPRRGRRRGAGADLVEVLEAANARVEPVCPHFGVCGGCRLQHMPSDAQRNLKQRGLLRALHEHGRVEPEQLLDSLSGPSTAYRRRARLGVKYVPGKGGTLVGFREKNGAKLAELDVCAVLEPRVGNAIGSIRRLLDRLDIRHRIPQLEVAMGDTATALVLRHLEPLSVSDRAVLLEFVAERDWQLHLQPGGPDSVQPLWPADPAPLSYALPDFDLDLEFLPTDFIQVNAAMNHALVRAAVCHLDVHADSRVLDLFCGIGNLTLAVARRAASVTGVDGDAALVSRALANARRNRIENVSFVSADLMRVDGQWDWSRGGSGIRPPWMAGVQGIVRNNPCLLRSSSSIPGLGRWDRLLLDPPRSGAEEVLSALGGRLGGPLGGRLPQRIVYVSCNPESLARDAALLVHRKGYRLRHAGIVDMFPHTAHCEAMAVFVRHPEA